jgi:putative NADPH-quinone reductase
MKMVAVFGSPRKEGNSWTLAEAFLEVIEKSGAEVTRFHLRKMRYSGCIACNACKKKAARCTLDDDLAPLLEAVREAEGLLVAAPVYFYDVPSQLKALMDRWYSFFKPDYFGRKDPSRLAPGKTGVLVVAQRAPEAFFGDVVQRYAHMLRRFGFGHVHAVRGGGLGDALDAAARRPDLLEMARRTAKSVLDGEPPDPAIPEYVRPAGPSRESENPDGSLPQRTPNERRSRCR